MTAFWLSRAMADPSRINNPVLAHQLATIEIVDEIHLSTRMAVRLIKESFGTECDGPRRRGQASCPREQLLLVRYFEEEGVAEARVWDLGTGYRMIENTMLSEDKSADQNSFGAVTLEYSKCGYTVQRNFPGSSLGRWRVRVDASSVRFEKITPRRDDGCPIQ